MLAAIKNFVQKHLAAPAQESAEAAERRARLAAAALLVEVVRDDEGMDPAERTALLGSLNRKFGLEESEAAELVALAEAEARDATDLYQFTSQINRHFTPEQKILLIEELWRVAYADEFLHHNEEHLIRKVAELIHVPHSSFIAAKLRVTRR
ncbi:MAG: hypothetical protein DIU71_00455 [Proteobacteria bacterium]|nr:MAG: hypothetical protein DIU71_00455 [Pseudomonadota bacterium]